MAIKTFCSIVAVKIRLILFFLAIVHSSFAAEVKFPVAEIPDSLKENAQIVVRYSDFLLHIESANKAVYSVSMAITVLNKNGKADAELKIYYDKFKKVKNISATVYDEKGERIKKIKPDDIKDYSAISGYSVFDENRVKYIDPGEFAYPYTVEYSYEISFNGLLDFPSWVPIDNYYASVQKSSYKAIVEPTASFRYLEVKLPGTCENTRNENASIYFWKCENLKAIKPEVFSQPFAGIVPILYTAPAEFEIENTTGRLDSWNEFGKWVYGLNQGRGQLSDATIKKVELLIKDAKSDKEKVEILYRYMQDNTRYVSIQVGIGSWQPMVANDVDRLAYGDCKALSNYMHSLLKVAGVESFYTLIQAGYQVPPLRVDFVSVQFNHAILCVPLATDTLWLECTSQVNPCGYIGNFTDDRYALLIKPEGGEIVHTKTYNSYENLKVTCAKVRYNENGYSKIEVQTKYNGTFFSEIVPVLMSDEKDRDKKMRERINLPGLNSLNFNHHINSSEVPLVIENMDLEILKYYLPFGNRLVFSPNILNRNEQKMDPGIARYSDICIPSSTCTIDSISYEIPEGYSLPTIPEDVKQETRFGRFSTQVLIRDNQLIYIRKVVMNKGTYIKNLHPEFAEFNNNLVNADRLKIALVKN